MKTMLNTDAAVLAELTAAFQEVPRVLHVDADGDTALVLAALLMPEIQVQHAATLAAAVEALEQTRFALVVMDPDLPDGDGALLLERLKHGPHGADTQVLLYSARHPGLRVQAHAFLPKPWTSPRQLWRTVSHLLGIEALAA
jgi:two-component system, OmpR family, phosphate regulon response regulator OmpR